MAPTIATIKVNDNTIVPLRIFVNRKKLLHNNTRENEFHTPLLSNNSIVYIKSPSTRIYLSNHDMGSLCTEIEADIIFILYELSSPRIKDDLLKNVRIGQVLDFQGDIMKKLVDSGYEGPSTTNIVTLTRLSKTKLKLHYKKNWELEIYINSMKKLIECRAALLMKEQGSLLPSRSIYSKRKTLLIHKEDVNAPSLLQEEDGSSAIERSVLSDTAADKKPQISFRYTPVTSFSEFIDIHVLQRPKRKKDLNKGI